MGITEKYEEAEILLAMQHEREIEPSHYYDPFIGKAALDGHQDISSTPED